MFKPRRSLGFHPITYTLLGCAVVAVLFALIDLPTDVQPSAVAAISHASATPPNLSPADLYERVAPSVVTIIVKDENGEPIGNGSGFFIDKAVLSGEAKRFQEPLLARKRGIP